MNDEAVTKPGAIVAFGEPLLRLAAPGRELLMQSGSLHLHVGGAEANVAVALARLGHPARLVSVLPDNALGRGAQSVFRSHGVDCSCLRFAEGRMGLYFVSPAAGLRPAEVIYDRAGSAFAEIAPQAYDWDYLLQRASRLHLTGITLALGPGPAQAALDAVAAAQMLQIPVSFDCNFRPRLWAGRTAQARTLMHRVVEAADILFANHFDIGLLLGLDLSGDEPDQRRANAERAFAAYSGLRLILSTRRRIANADTHWLAARLDRPEGGCETGEIELSGIVDRIGSGDAFAAGVLHGLAEGFAPEEVLEAGLGLACLKHALPGDASLSSRYDLARFSQRGCDVRR